MIVTKKSVALAVSSAFALSLGTAAFAAEDNPFKIRTLSNGYQVADNHAEKGAEGKCGAEKGAEGKCSAEKAKEGKCGEGKCGADKTNEGKCGEGKCGGKEKMEEGKCGEGKCGQ